MLSKKFLKNVKILAFDLDGTLTESKQKIKKDLLFILKKLSKKYLILIIGGGRLSQIRKQIGFSKNFIIGAVSGTIVFYKNKILFKEKDITKKQYEKIKKIILEELENFKFKPKKIWGKLIDFRKTQITISFLGQKATLKEKIKFKNLDKKFKIRRKFLKLIKKRLKNFNITLGGLTSLDITRYKNQKALCLKKIIKIFKINKDQILFFGNEIYPGGNDFSIKVAGFKIIKVKNPEDTKRKLIIILNKIKDYEKN